MKKINGGIIILCFLALTNSITIASDRIENNQANSVNNQEVENNIDTSTWHFTEQDLQVLHRNLIQEEGFQEHEINTIDQNRINALFLDREQDAKVTIIFVSDSIYTNAPFVKIAPQNCNLLFMGLRSPQLAPLDIIATCLFAHRVTHGKPIILHGRSLGALFAAQSFPAMQQLRTMVPQLAQLLSTVQIKGLIFDSGFTSISETEPDFFQYASNRIQNVSNNPLSWLHAIGDIALNGIKNIGSSLLNGLRYLPVIGNRINQILPPQQDIINHIVQAIGNLPVFFVHSEDDPHSPITKIQEFASKIPTKYPWLIPAGQSQHAKHHLLLPDDYKRAMKEFIQIILNPPIPNNIHNNNSNNSNNLPKKDKKAKDIDNLFNNKKSKKNKKPNIPESPNNKKNNNSDTRGVYRGNPSSNSRSESSSYSPRRNNHYSRGRNYPHQPSSPNGYNNNRRNNATPSRRNVAGNNPFCNNRWQNQKPNNQPQLLDDTKITSDDMFKLYDGYQDPEIEDEPLPRKNEIKKH